MADGTGIVEPKIAEIAIGGALLGTFSAISSRLAALQMFSIEESPDQLVLLSVESRDIQKRPYLFFIITLLPKQMKVQYSIALDSSEKMRRLSVVKNLLSVLSLITDLYTVDASDLYQYADSAIDDVLTSLSQSYSSLFNSYDSLFNEYRELKRLNLELAAANKSLTVQASQLSEENKDLSARLATLETYSDESLMVMIEDWIESHSDTIDIMECSKTYRLTAPRVEQMLNKMVSMGYIELKG